MPRPDTGTRDRLIDATLVGLRRGGLSAAGLNEVAALASAPKGSMYHHFPGGKAELVEAAIGRYREQVAEALRASLAPPGGWPVRVRRCFAGVARRQAAAGWAESCAVGAVLADLAPDDARMRAACAAALDRWAAVAADALPADWPRARRASGGRLLVTLLEGAQLAARARADARPLDEAAAAFVAWMSLAPPAADAPRPRRTRSASPEPR